MELKDKMAVENEMNRALRRISLTGWSAVWSSESSEKTRGDLQGAAVAFRAFYRLGTHQVGQPDYTEPIIWSLIESRIKGTTTEGGKRPQPPEPDGEAGSRTWEEV